MTEEVQPQSGALPQISLLVNLMDLSGTQLGQPNFPNPAYLRIALCGFGPFIPRIVGTAFIGKVATWPGDIPYNGSQINVQIWGNDVITPSGTYYCISVLDTNKNVIASNIYTFVGTQTVDLSTVTPSVPSPGWTNNLGIIQIPYAAAMTIPGTGSNFSMYQTTLTGDVTSNQFSSLTPGIVIFEIQQDANGGHKWIWPNNVLGGGVVNPLPTSTSTQIFFYDGINLRPLGSMVYS